MIIIYKFINYKMSCFIEKSKLSNEQKQNLIKSLTFIPTKESYSKYDTTPSEPIYFFKVTPTHVIIPYITAAKELSIIPNEDKQFKTIDLEFTGKLRDYQVSIFAESKEQLETYGTTTLALGTGVGKTLIGAICASEYKLLTVILVTQTILVNQWKKTFENNTTGKVWIVGEKEPEEYNVIICMDQRWMKIPEEIRTLVGMVIIDEAHLFCTPSRVACLLAFQPFYIIIETATLERDDNLHYMMYAIAGEHGVYRANTTPFKVYKILTNVSVERKMNKQKRTDYGKLQKDTMFDTRRLDIIYNLVKYHPLHNILVLTKNVEHVKTIYNELSKTESSDFLCGNKKSYNDCRVLVGTAQKIGTGFDQENFCKDYKGNKFDLLIITFSIKKYQQLCQNVGRVLRSEYPYVFHFKDNDPIYDNHWRKCEAWYKKRSAEITIFNIDDKVINMDENLLA
jgi:superfamily II DNA or RNA helicase